MPKKVKGVWTSKYPTHKISPAFKKKKRLPVQTDFINHARLRSQHIEKINITVDRKNEKRFTHGSENEKKYKTISITFIHPFKTDPMFYILRVPMMFPYHGHTKEYLNRGEAPSDFLRKHSLTDKNVIRIKSLKTFDDKFLMDHLKWRNTLQKARGEVYTSKKTPKAVTDKAKRWQNGTSPYYGRRHPKPVKNKVIEHKFTMSDKLVCIISPDGIVRRIWLSEKLDKQGTYNDWKFTSKKVFKRYVTSQEKITYKEVPNLEEKRADNLAKLIRENSERDDSSKKNVVLSCTRNRKKRKNRPNSSRKNRRVLNNTYKIAA